MKDVRNVLTSLLLISFVLIAGIWTRGGAVLVDRFNRVILCDDCPCGSSSSSFSSSSDSSSSDSSSSSSSVSVSSRSSSSGSLTIADCAACGLEGKTLEVYGVSGIPLDGNTNNAPCEFDPGLDYVTGGSDSRYKVWFGCFVDESNRVVYHFIFRDCDRNEGNSTQRFCEDIVSQDPFDTGLVFQNASGVEAWGVREVE